MASKTVSGLRIHGQFIPPDVMMNLTVSSEVLVDGNVKITYSNASLNYLGGSSYFGYPIILMTGNRPNVLSTSYDIDKNASSDDRVILAKNANPSTWGDGYKGSYNKTASITVPRDEIGTNGVYEVYVTVGTNGTAGACDNCPSTYTNGYPIKVTDLQVLINNPSKNPNKPSISVSPSSTVLVGSTFTVSCNATDFNYTTNNGTSYSSNASTRSFTIPSNHSIYNYKFRARNRDYSYVNEWSDYVEATVSAKLNIPNSPTFSPDPVLYNDNVTVVTPSYPTSVNWDFVWNDSYKLQTRNNITTTGLTCRIRARKNNFVSSDYSNDSSVLGVKLNLPSDLSYLSKPVILNESVTLSCTKNINPADSTVMYEYGEASTYDNITSWSALSGNTIDHITSNRFWVRVRTIDPDGKFISSDYSKLDSAISVKLPKPGIIDQFTSITILNTLSLSFTYDSQLSPLNENAVFVLFGFKDKTLSEVVKSVNPNKNYFKIIKSGEQSEIADGFISIFKALDGAVFKLQLSKAGYVDSDLSESSNEVVIYYEPNKMTDHGFAYKFLSENSDIVNNQLVFPGQSVSSNWSSYSSVRSGQNDPGPDNGLMFGRFSRYRLELQKKVNDSEYKTVSQVSGSNDPSKSGNSSTITINPSYTYGGDNVVAGSICRLALTCYYNSTGPVEESPVFYSPEFQVAGYTNKPEMIYPSVESGKLFTTCNLKPKLVFKVSNPEYLPDAQIYDIRVEVVEGTRISTYTFKNNPEYFLLSKSLTSDGHIQNETYVSFTLTESTLNRTVRIWSSNSYMENDLPITVTSSYQDLKYPIKGEVISQTQISTLYNALTNVVNSGYSKLKIDSGVTLRNYASYDKYPVVLLDTVKDLTQSLVKIHQELLKYTSRRVTDFTGSPEFIANSIIVSETIDSENPQFVEGNYFNNIVYILKTML